MSKWLSCGFAALLVFAGTVIARGESAHKGWMAQPDILPDRLIPWKLSLSSNLVDIRDKDPLPNCVLHGRIDVPDEHPVTVKRVYLLTTTESGELVSRDVEFKPPVAEPTGISGRTQLHFITAKTKFAEGDIFAVVLHSEEEEQANQQKGPRNGNTVVFLRIRFYVAFS